jgi:endonuclease V-like protein UPF0215 family
LTLRDSDCEIHVLGVEDGSFAPFQRVEPSYTYFCGVETVLDIIKNVRLRMIEVDGFDATEKLLTMMPGMAVGAVILGGITFGGFNIVNPFKILMETHVPVIIYSGTRPNNEKILSALKNHFEDWRERWEIIERLGPVYSTTPHPKETPVYFEVVGASKEWAEKIFHSLAVVSRIPEPVRVAGLIARGISPAFSYQGVPSDAFLD